RQLRVRAGEDRCGIDRPAGLGTQGRCEMNSAAVMTEEAAVSASEALFARARQVLPGGVSRNAVLRRPHPIYVAHGEGCYVTDIEGVRRIDFSNNMTSQIHGHAHPAIVAA